jgi:hypothetical protein
LSGQPVPGTCPAFAGLKRAASSSPIWPCSRWGFPCLVDCSSSGGLLPRRFTLAAAHTASAAVCFLWHFPSAAPFVAAARVYLNPHGLELRGIAPCGVRTFLPGPAFAEPERFSALPGSCALYGKDEKVTSILGEQNAPAYHRRTVRIDCAAMRRGTLKKDRKAPTWPVSRPCSCCR